MDIIKFNDWQKIDLRVGEIKEVEDHPDADKLFIIKVDMGEKVIQIVAGVKGYYTKEELVGKKIIVFTNLEPKEIRGIKGEGMLLAATNEDKVVIISPEKDIKNGSRIS